MHITNLRQLAATLSFVTVALLSSRMQAANREIEVRDDIKYARPGGVALSLDAYLVSRARATPAVIYIHGGGFVSGDKRSIRDSTSELGKIKDLILDAGISVLAVNYRLAPAHPYPAATDDIQDAIAFVKQHAHELRIDPDRLALMGESAGGMLVSHAGAKYRAGNKVAAVVSFYGEHDFLLRVTENPCAMDGYTVKRPAGGCISNGMAAFLGFKTVTPEKEPVLRDATVVTHVHASMPPYLLVHGTRDYGVPIEQAHSMVQAMDQVGAECKLVAIVGGGHGGWDRPDQQYYKQVLIDWLRTRLSPE